MPFMTTPTSPGIFTILLIGVPETGALVTFHDYADYFPGVKKFVDELLSLGDYRLIERVKSLVVLERKRAS